MILPNPIEATGKSGPNWPKIILAGFIILAGLFLVWQFTFASTIFEDDFETYSLGELLNQGGWSTTTGYTNYVNPDEFEVQSSITKVGAKAVKIFGGVGVNQGIEKTGTPKTSGTIGVWIMRDNEVINSYDSYLIVEFVEKANYSTSTNIAGVALGYSSVLSMSNASNSTWAINVWKHIQLEWQSLPSEKIRWKIDDGNWSAWVSPAGYWNYGIDTIRFVETFGNTTNGYFDSITEAEPELNCGDYETPIACTNEGGENPTNNCAWNYLIAYCQPYFLETPTSTFDFIDYYAEHSNFSTPTAFILSLSDFASPLIENLQSFLDGFDDIFDKTEASAKGAEIGSAIPTARGYLAVINDFFGDFPISELFIFLILTILVIIVFRVIRTLIQLVKVW